MQVPGTNDEVIKTGMSKSVPSGDESNAGEKKDVCMENEKCLRRLAAEKDECVTALLNETVQEGKREGDGATINSRSRLQGLRSNSMKAQER